MKARAAGDRSRTVGPKRADEEETGRRRHPPPAGRGRDPHARAVRHAPQPRRQAAVAGRARRGGEDAPTCSCPTVTDEIDASVLAQAGPNLKLIANFGNGVDNIDVQAALVARHHRDQHAGRPHRRHRRHDDGADPGGGAAHRRGRARDPGRRLGRLVADLDARPPHHRQAPRHRRHGPHRPGAGPPRQGLRPVDPLPQPPPRAGPRSRRSSRRPTGRASTRCSPAWTSCRSTARTRPRPTTCSRRAASSC